jgi:PIN domain nuclease of toxin-antitoxin system
LNLLLDTHVFLWWDAGSGALGQYARDAIATPDNAIFISAASIWEIAIKRRVGKLAFDSSATAAIGANGFRELPMLPIDGENAGDLAWHHNDPFDRVLVAQAIRLGLTLVTADRRIAEFSGVALLWGA